MTRLAMDANSSVTRRFGPIVVGLLSFLVYAIMVLTLGQGEHGAERHEYANERTVVASAVSKIVYHAPIGSYFVGVDRVLQDTSAPVKSNLSQAISGNIARGELIPQVRDGTAFGFVFVETFAMRHFGLRLSSMTLIFLALLGMATLVFLLRFDSGAALFIPVYYLALGAMLLTPLVTNPDISDEVPIGGYRYYSLLAIIPAIHIIFELTLEKKPLAGLLRRACVAVGVGLQTILLVHVGMASNSANYLPLLIGLAFVIALWTHRGDARYRATALRKALAIGAVAVVASGLFYRWTPPSYRASGHVVDGVWSRVFTSLGVNPAWPFGNLNEVYSGCKKHIPAGLRPGNIDQNGHCVWAVYAEEHGIPFGQMMDEIYDNRFESVMRNTLFKVALAYPKETIAAFLYYKPLMILDTMKELLRFDLTGGDLFRTGLLLLQIGLLVGFALFVMNGLPGQHTTMLAGLMVLGALSTLPLYIVAWSNTLTSSELLFYILGLGGVALVAIVDGLRRVALRSGRRTRDFEAPA